MTSLVFDQVKARITRASQSALDPLPRHRSLVCVKSQLPSRFIFLSLPKLLPFAMGAAAWVTSLVASFLLGAFTTSDTIQSTSQDYAFPEDMFIDGVTVIDEHDERILVALFDRLNDLSVDHDRRNMQHVTEKSAPSRAALKSLARRVAADEGLDPDLFARLVRWESNYDPKAISPKGAMGLAQLMPGTAAELGLSPSQYFEPEANLRGGARYLKGLIDKTGDVKLALGAYNAGLGRVSGRPFENWPQETRKYVPRVLGEGVALDRLVNSSALVGGITTISFSAPNPSENTEENKLGAIDIGDQDQTAIQKETDDA